MFILCGLGSVLTEVGVISKYYLAAALLGREDIHSCKEQQVFIGAGVEISIILEVIISWKYCKALASVCKQTIGSEPHIYLILSSPSIWFWKCVTSQKQRFSNEQIRYVALLLSCQAWLFKSTSTFCFISPEFWKSLLHLTLGGWEFWTQWLFISHYQQRRLDSRISVISSWGLKGTTMVTSH